MKRNSSGLIAAVFASSIICSHANPTGGSVASGAASICNNPATSTLTINQTSNVAIINWATFNIASGETTSFIQPSAASATLNRVMSTGGTSIINGNLTSTGSVYLINGNGILIGPGGVVNTGGSFTASTRDISDNDFLSGNLHFTGNNPNGVQNMGSVTALGGNVYMIGKTVDNEGTIEAPNGTAGLAAGDDVLLAQENADGSTITVNPSSNASAAPGQTGVKNGTTGVIHAMNAELQAANGNLYALAINNGGTIRANTVTHQGGHIYLSADLTSPSTAGTVVNSGTLDASATAPEAAGGSVAIKNYYGTTNDSGSILAKGGANGRAGQGGNAEILSQTISYTGTTDLTAPGGGFTGTLALGAEKITVQPTGDSDPSTFNSIFTTSVIENTLATANLEFITTDIVDHPEDPLGTITVNSPLAWNSNSTLLFGSTDTVYLNGNIVAPNGGIGFNAVTITSGSPGNVNPAGVTANIDVNNFTLFAGSFVQNGFPLPAFQVTKPLVLGAGDFFLRSGGGSGTTDAPYILVDNPGVSGIPTFPDGTVYVIDFGNDTPAVTTVTIDPMSLLSFDANTSKSGTLYNVTLDPNATAANQPGVNDPNGDGSGVNGGNKKGGTIASGSSLASIPSPSRLLTAGSGINTMFNGGVMAIKPPPFVTQELDSILNIDAHGDLDGAAFGSR